MKKNATIKRGPGRPPKRTFTQRVADDLDKEAVTLEKRAAKLRQIAKDLR